MVSLRCGFLMIKKVSIRVFIVCSFTDFPSIFVFKNSSPKNVVITISPVQIYNCSRKSMFSLLFSIDLSLSTSA